METFQINLLYTLIAAMVVLFSGGFLVERVELLKRLSIPASVAGGVLIALLMALVEKFAGLRFSFDMSFKDPLLLVFFVTVGLAADVRMLVKGGPKLLSFLLVCTSLIIVQNAIGILLAIAMDLHPAIGLLAGSITLSGGHGTGAAYALRFADTMGLHGAMEMAMASATAGLVIGGLLGGAMSEYLISRYRLSGALLNAAQDQSLPQNQEAEVPDEVTPSVFLYTAFVILVCLGIGKIVAQWVETTGFILPDFLFCLLLGVLIRNSLLLSRKIRISDRTVGLLGNISLSMFLVMTLMAMHLTDLSAVAGPLITILIVQTAAIALFVTYVTFPVMGRNYDAAILAGGHVGFGMGTTAIALAIIKSVTDRQGPSRMAFLIVPIVGAFFLDVTNAIIIQGFLALPIFKFG